MTRCPQCPGVTRLVEPTGPQPARVLMIGEAPGKEEDRYGRPFVGKSGQESDQHYLPMAGLCRDDVRVTNAVLCFPTHCKNNTPTPDLVKTCSNHHLARELLYTDPEIIIAFGAVACGLFGIRGLEMYHGIPRRVSYPTNYGETWDGWVFPTYHPAAAMREPRMMMRLHSDMEQLRLLLRGEYVAPIDEYPEPDYRHIKTELELRVVLGDDGAFRDHVELAKDTETTPLKIGVSPWCVTFSFRPGTGRLILAKDRKLIDFFNAYIHACRPFLLYHNYLYDLPVEQDMGLTACTSLPYTDTMVEAYHVGSIAHGLKSIAYRYCGMVMQDYADLVTPYSEGFALSHLFDLIAASKEYQMANPYPYDRVKGERRTPLYKRIERITTDYMKRGGYKPGHGYEPIREGDKKSVNLWERWNKVKSTIMEGVEDEDTQPDILTTGIDIDTIPSNEPGEETEPTELPDDPDSINSVNLPKPEQLKGVTEIVNRKITAACDNKNDLGMYKEYEKGRRVKELVWLVSELGEVPAKSIAHVPFDKALYYACRDADATIRIWPKIRELQRKVRKEAKIWEA